MRVDLASGRWADIASAAHATPGARIPYTVGRVVVHSGHLLHQAAGVTKVAVTDERITLQGHGVFADGAWRLYW
jgi:hypothetical protein